MFLNFSPPLHLDRLLLSYCSSRALQSHKIREKPANVVARQRHSSLHVSNLPANPSEMPIQRSFFTFPIIGYTSRAKSGPARNG